MAMTRAQLSGRVGKLEARVGIDVPPIPSWPLPAETVAAATEIIRDLIGDDVLAAVLNAGPGESIWLSGDDPDGLTILRHRREQEG